MSEIAACTLIQEEPDRKTERYMMMFKDYPDVVSVDSVVEYLIDQDRQLGGMRLSNSLAPSLQNTSESSKLMMPKQRTFGCEQKGASL